MLIQLAVVEHQTAWDCRCVVELASLGDHPSESNHSVVVVHDGSPVAADSLLLSRAVTMAVRCNLDQMAQRHDRESEGHASGLHGNDLHERGRRANVRRGDLRCVNDRGWAMPSQNRVGIRRSIGSETIDHAEADIHSVRYRRIHFCKGRQSQRKRESHGADSGLCWDTRCGHTHGNRRARNNIGGHDHGGCKNGRERSRRGRFHTCIGLTRELRCSRKVPARIELPAWWCETWFDPVGLVGLPSKATHRNLAPH